MTTADEPCEIRSPGPVVTGNLPSLRRRLLVPTLVLAGSLLAVVSSLGAPLIAALSRVDEVSLSTDLVLVRLARQSGGAVRPHYSSGHAVTPPGTTITTGLGCRARNPLREAGGDSYLCARRLQSSRNRKEELE